MGKHKSILKFSILAVAFMAVIVYFSASVFAQIGNVYYIAPNGSDSNDGSVNSPWATFDYVLKNTGPGDTVYCREGTYTETVDNYNMSFRGGSAGAWWTLSSYPGETCNFNASIKFYYNVQYIRIKNLNIINGRTLKIEKPSSFDDASMAHDIEFIGNTLTGPQPSIGYLRFYGNRILVENNTIISSGGGGSLDHGIYAHIGSDYIIRGNYIENTYGHAIHVYDEGKPYSISNILIENNILRKSRGRSGVIIAHGGQTSIDNVTIRNNIITDNAYAGVVVSGGRNDNIKIYNNTIYNNNYGNNGRGQIYITEQYGNPSNIEIKNNIIDFASSPYSTHIKLKFGTAVNVVCDNNFYYPGPISNRFCTDNNGIIGNPNFVDTPTNDFHLQSTSPAIDTGLTLPSVTTDYDNNPRPMDGDKNGTAEYDIGAYEFTGTYAPPPPPLPCALTNAYWSTTSAAEGEPVNLIIEGNNCDGEKTSFNIKENDLLFDDPAQVQPNNATFSGNTVQTAWTAEHDGDLLSDPEFYFDASLVSDTANAISSKGLANGLLAVTRDTTAPAIPQNLAAASISSTRIDLAWDVNSEPDLAGYKIYRDGTEIAVTTINSYPDANLAANTTYNYAVSAYDGRNNESGQSNSASGATQTSYQCSDGQDNDSDGLTDYPSDPGCESITDDDEYDDITPPLTAAMPAGGTYSSAQTVVLSASEEAITYYTLDGADPAAQSAVYSIPIQISQTTTLKFFSVDTAGNTETIKNEIYTIEPTDTIPPAISNVQLTDLVSNSASITWETDELATSRVDYGTTVNYGSSLENLELLQSHSAILTGLTPETAYYYQITSADASGNSSSQIDQFTTNSSLILSLFMSEGSGNTVSDSSDYKNGGIVYGAAWTEGRVGSALQFNGSDSFVKVDNSESLNPDKELTVIAWVKPDQPNDGEQRNIIYKRGAWGLAKGGPGQIYGSVNVSGEDKSIESSQGAFNGKWQHVAMTFNGSVMRIYSDGRMIAENNYAGEIGTTGNDLVIGTGNSQAYWNGAIDEIKIYSRSLSSDEIFNDYDGVNKFPQINAVGAQSVRENELLETIISAIDPDGDNVSLAAGNLPQGATFNDNGNNSGLLSWTPDYDQAGGYEITLAANDGNGGSNTAIITIGVENVNRPPVLENIGNKSVNKQMLLKFTVSASDPDGNSVVLTAINLPRESNFVDNGDGTGTFSWTPGVDQVGNYPGIRFEASDIQYIDNEDISITVVDVDVTGPTVPENLAVESITYSQINLSWNESTDDVAVAGYKVFRNGLQISNMAKNRYLDTGLSQETNYVYAVSAYDASGNESDKSELVSATTGRIYGISDFIILLNNWLSIGESASDLNNDSIVNTIDMGIMMSNWE